MTSIMHVAGSLSTAVPSVILIQYQFGRPLESTIAPHDFLRTQLYAADAQFIKFNLSVPRGAMVGVYGRRSAQPTHVQYDFFNVVDGDKVILSANERRPTRSLQPMVSLSWNVILVLVCIK